MPPGSTAANNPLESGATISPGPARIPGGTLELNLTTVNLDFSLPVPEKNMNLAWGAGYRRDNYQIKPEKNTRTEIMTMDSNEGENFRHSGLPWIQA